MNYDKELMCHMICAACGKPGAWPDWEYIEEQHDKLMCPNCLQSVEIGEWIDGPVPTAPKQKCLMCGGTGECKSH